MENKKALNNDELEKVSGGSLSDDFYKTTSGYKSVKPASAGLHNDESPLKSDIGGIGGGVAIG